MGAKSHSVIKLYRWHVKNRLILLLKVSAIFVIAISHKSLMFKIYADIAE
jgi:hypothetical protein